MLLESFLRYTVMKGFALSHVLRPLSHAVRQLDTPGYAQFWGNVF